MIDELREEEIVNKVGGRFKLSTLIQKRLVPLQKGSPAAGTTRHTGQDADRDSGDHGGQDLPGCDHERPRSGRVRRAWAARRSWTSTPFTPLETGLAPAGGAGPMKGRELVLE